jgi:hypothetical protein
VKYGERATTYMRENGTTLSIVAVVVLAVGFGIFTLWRKRTERAKGR